MAPFVRVFRDIVLRDLDKVKNSKYQNAIKIGSGSVFRNCVIAGISDQPMRGGIVVLDKEAYVNEVTKILSDSDTYIPLRKGPGPDFQQELIKVVNRGFQHEVINQKEKLFLVPSFPRTPIRYIKILFGHVAPYSKWYRISNVPGGQIY